MVDIPQIKPHRAGATLSIQVVPNASRTEIIGTENGYLKVRINAVPEDGKANKKLIEFLSETFKVPKARIQLLKGDASRLKQVLFEGVTVEYLIQVLQFE